jgi:ribosomal protein S4
LLEKRNRQKIIDQETNRQYAEYLKGKPKYRIGQGRVSEFILDKKELDRKLEEAGFMTTGQKEIIKEASKLGTEFLGL